MKEAGQSAIGLLPDAPDVPDDLEQALDAWKDLSSCRALGAMVIGPIPWTAVCEWADRNGIIDDVDFDDLAHFLKAMDEVYLRMMMAKMAKGEGKSSDGGGPGTVRSTLQANRPGGGVWGR